MVILLGLSRSASIRLKRIPKVLEY